MTKRTGDKKMDKHTEMRFDRPANDESIEEGNNCGIFEDKFEVTTLGYKVIMGRADDTIGNAPTSKPEINEGRNCRQISFNCPAILEHFFFQNDEGEGLLGRWTRWAGSVAEPAQL